MMVDKAAKIGWIGTGVMGKSMAGYLLKSGLSMDVFYRYVQEFGHILNDPYSVNPSNWSILSDPNKTW